MREREQYCRYHHLLQKEGGEEMEAPARLRAAVSQETKICARRTSSFPRRRDGTGRSSATAREAHRNKALPKRREKRNRNAPENIMFKTISKKRKIT